MESVQRRPRQSGADRPIASQRSSVFRGLFACGVSRSAAAARFPSSREGFATPPTASHSTSLLSFSLESALAEGAVSRELSTQTLKTEAFIDAAAAAPFVSPEKTFPRPRREELCNGLPRLPLTLGASEAFCGNALGSPSSPSLRTFILHLEPARGSVLQAMLRDRQREVAAEFGADRTHCYSPHCSVTGFFDCADIQSVKTLLEALARQQQDADRRRQRAGEALEALSVRPLSSKRVFSDPSGGRREDAQERERRQRVSQKQSHSQQRPETLEPKSAAADAGGGVAGDDQSSGFDGRGKGGEDRESSPSHPPRRVIATDDGYVVLPLRCQGMHAFVRPLQELLERQSVKLRLKRVDHVTLAESRWDPRQREAIAEVYNKTLAEKGAACSPGPWDLVLYELQRRSAGFDVDGPHAFTEHIRFRGLATHMLSFPWQTAA